MEKLDEIWMSDIYKAVGATSAQHSYGPSKTNMYKCLCCGKVFTATYNWRGYMSGGWADSSLFLTSKVIDSRNRLRLDCIESSSVIESTAISSRYPFLIS